MLNAKQICDSAIWHNDLVTLRHQPQRQGVGLFAALCRRENRFNNNTAALSGNASLLALMDE